MIIATYWVANVDRGSPVSLQDDSSSNTDSEEKAIAAEWAEFKVLNMSLGVSGLGYSVAFVGVVGMLVGVVLAITISSISVDDGSLFHEAKYPYIPVGLSVGAMFLLIGTLTLGIGRYIALRSQAIYAELLKRNVDDPRSE